MTSEPGVKIGDLWSFSTAQPEFPCHGLTGIVGTKALSRRVSALKIGQYFANFGHGFAYVRQKLSTVQLSSPSHGGCGGRAVAARNLAKTFTIPSLNCGYNDVFAFTVPHQL
jgi:hypothetical protein